MNTEYYAEPNPIRPIDPKLMEQVTEGLLGLRRCECGSFDDNHDNCPFD